MKKSLLTINLFTLLIVIFLFGCSESKVNKNSGPECRTDAEISKKLTTDQKQELARIGVTRNGDIVISEQVVRDCLTRKHIVTFLQQKVAGLDLTVPSEFIEAQGKQFVNVIERSWESSLFSDGAAPLEKYALLYEKSSPIKKFHRLLEN